MIRPWLLFCCLWACTPEDDREGTFIGNPSLTARYLDTTLQIGMGGVLDSDELHLVGCEGVPDARLGPTEFTFDGALAVETASLPSGRYCELFVVIRELTIAFDDVALGAVSVTATDFDLRIPTDIDTATGQQFVIQLGDADWLPSMAEHASPGANDVRDDADLRAAYLEGLDQGSTVENFTNGS